MKNSEIHVVYGTGPLGTAVMRQLVKDGKFVRMVNRSGKAEVPQGVEILAGDAYDPSFTRQVSKDAVAVYQCAQPAYNEWPQKFPPLQASILEGAAAQGAKLIAPENLYMYGEVAGPLTETLPNAATTRKGQTRARMSETLLEAHASGKARVAIGRASDFYGPGVLESAVGERVFYPALAGKTVTALGNLDALHTYTFIDDFARALVILGQRDEALGGIWHVPCGETLTTRQFLSLVFQEAGHEPKISAAPEIVLRLMGIFMPSIREIIEMLYEFEKPLVMDASKFTRAFGDTSTPHREAIRQTLDWFREHPRRSPVA
jgi:nucleoside-diphosphate-sugar epimerase